MRSRFEKRYNLIVVYDSGRAVSYEAYTYADVEGRVRSLLKMSGVKRVDVQRIESFHYKTFHA